MNHTHKLPWLLAFVFACATAITVTAWVKMWPIPRFAKSGAAAPAVSEDGRAWQSACDAVRVRLKYPAEAKFPDMPAVRVVPDNVHSLALLTLQMDAVNGLFLKGGGEASKYYEWRQELLNRVELTRERDEWAAAGWVESSNAMGVRGRVSWIARIEYQSESNHFRATEVQLIDTED